MVAAKVMIGRNAVLQNANQTAQMQNNGLLTIDSEGDFGGGLRLVREHQLNAMNSSMRLILHLMRNFFNYHGVVLKLDG